MIGLRQRPSTARLAAPVSVLTLLDGDRRHGMTVSTVTVVSLRPFVVGAALWHRSRFLDAVRRNGRFCINVLSADQAGIAHRFADPRRPRDGQFCGLPMRTDPASGAPLIDGCLAHLGCRFVRCVPVGDHVLLLAEVESSDGAAGEPLLSVGGVLCRGRVTPARVEDRLEAL